MVIGDTAKESLYSVTPPEALMPLNNGSQGASLVSFCLKANEFDIPWDLLSKCPILATIQSVSEANSPIFKLSRIHSGFLSGLQLKFWQKWIYDSISIQAAAMSDNHDLSIAVSNSVDDGGTQRGLVISAVTLLKRLVAGIFEVLGINRIYKMKLIHAQMLEFISFMGEATRNMDDLTLAQHTFVTRSIFEAIERGDLEFVTHVCKANPKLVKIRDENGKSIFHFAIESRQEDVVDRAIITPSGQAE